MYRGETKIINNVKDAHIWLILPGESSQSLIEQMDTAPFPDGKITRCLEIPEVQRQKEMR